MQRLVLLPMRLERLEGRCESEIVYDSLRTFSRLHAVVPGEYVPLIFGD
jgi:hypothetical protein